MNEMDTTLGKSSRVLSSMMTRYVDVKCLHLSFTIGLFCIEHIAVMPCLANYQVKNVDYIVQDN